MFCPVCGANNADEARFCPTCGAGLPGVATTPTAPIDPGQLPPGAPNPEASPSSPPAPVSPQPSPSGKRTGRIALIVALILAILIAAGALGYAVYRTTKNDTDAKPAKKTAEKTKSESPDGEPADAVRAFYSAVEAGDLKAVKATMTAKLAKKTDAGSFEGWDSPDYRISRIDESNGEKGTLVEVDERSGGLSNGMVTFELVVEKGSWRIARWKMGNLDGATEGDDSVSDDNSTSSTQPDESTSVGEVLTAANAERVVDTFLASLKGDDMPTMKASATSRLLTDDPGLFRPSSEAFLEYTITESFRDGGTFVVKVQEEWISGPETVMYVVVEENGKALVDAQIFESDL